MKIEVHPQGGTRRVIEIEAGATKGATVGVNVWNQDGSLFVPAAVTPETGGPPITYWRLILEIPPNVVALAETTTTGLYVITGAGTSATRTIAPVAGETTVANGSGVSGDPTVGLADVANSGAGALLAIARDGKGRVTGAKAATITGTAGQVDVANGDAVAGLPTISLADVADAGGGTFKLLTRDAKGRLSGTSDGDTDDVPEGAGNLYFTAARVRDTLLTGLSLASSAVISATDSVLSAFGKLQAQITALASSLSGYVPTSRTISTTAPLTGGGNLTANRTLAISAATTSAAGSMSGADKTKLDGIATGATVGATWGTNLSNIPVNIASWASIAPASKADDSSVVHLTGNETISGTKTFLSFTELGNFSYANNPTGGGFFASRNGVAALPAAGTNTGRYGFQAFSGSGYSSPSEIRGYTSEAWISGSAIGSELRFYTTANGSTTLGERWRISSDGHLAPAADNAFTLGWSVRRPSVLWAASGTIATSDAREKTPIEAFTDAELACAAELASEIGTYRWLHAIEAKGDEARTHVGLTVQRVIEVMSSRGLDPFRYGFVCYDEWPEQQEIVESWAEERDDDGNVVREAGSDVVQEYQPAGNRYSFRMDELLAFIARGQEERLRRLEQALGL